MNQTVSEKETPTGTPEAEVDVHVGICPYFKKDRGKGRLNCEGATFRFPTCWRAGRLQWTIFMKGSMHTMSKTPKKPHRIPYKLLPTAIEETLKLYHAWLGYLLTLLQVDTLRVKVEDIKTALDDFSCTVIREGGEYVIRLQTEKEQDHE